MKQINYKIIVFSIALLTMHLSLYAQEKGNTSNLKVKKDKNEDKEIKANLDLFVRLIDVESVANFKDNIEDSVVETKQEFKYYEYKGGKLPGNPQLKLVGKGPNFSYLKLDYRNGDMGKTFFESLYQHVYQAKGWTKDIFSLNDENNNVRVQFMDGFIYIFSYITETPKPITETPEPITEIDVKKEVPVPAQEKVDTMLVKMYWSSFTRTTEGESSYKTYFYNKPESQLYKRNGKYYFFIGSKLISPGYDECEELPFERAIVKLNGKFGVVDLNTNNTLVNFSFDNYRIFHTSTYEGTNRFIDETIIYFYIGKTEYVYVSHNDYIMEKSLSELGAEYIARENAVKDYWIDINNQVANMGKTNKENTNLQSKSKIMEFEAILSKCTGKTCIHCTGTGKMEKFVGMGSSTKTEEVWTPGIREINTTTGNVTEKDFRFMNKTVSVSVPKYEQVVCTGCGGQGICFSRYEISYDTYKELIDQYFRGLCIR